MTERDILKWINLNLSNAIDKAIAHAREKYPDLIYTKDWLAAMAMRETGFKIAEFVKLGKKPEAIHTIMRGDYGQRKGDVEKCYHGFGYWQIDIASYPDFVKSGDWKDPFKTCRKAISVLEEKRLYLAPKFPNLQGDSLCRAITAAYNCGQGNVAKVLRVGQDIDARTYNRDYSAEVWRFRQIFNSLQ
jgi:hypothetical protein